ncbi:MAG: hypothetical protein P8O70_21850 [SAR324 cluster bacterium]|jgi:hypothetical protein|nr:hypothetical protein [SAR324 cluster bacterium]
MKALFLGITFILTAQIGLAAKSVRLDSARIKDCFILGYCDVQIMDSEELPRGWRERQLDQPVLRIRILDINEADQFACRDISRQTKWEYAKTQLRDAPTLRLEINGKFKGTHATRVFVDDKSLADLIIQFAC